VAGKIGATPSAEPGVAVLAPATSSTPWPRNTTLHSAAEEKPAHARGFQRTAALDARQAALAGASMSLLGLGRVKTFSCKRSELEGVATRAIFPDLCPDHGHQRLNAHNVHHAGEVVGKHVQRHLGGNLRKTLH